MTTQNVVPLVTRHPTFIPDWTFADRFRKARQTVGMDQRTFAQQLGCSAGAIAQWETGVSKPRDLVVMAQQVQAVTGVAAVWLLGIEPQDDSPQNTKKAPTPKGEGLPLPEMDSNHQPAGIKPDGAEIIEFPARHAAVEDDIDAPLATVTTLRRRA